MSGAVRDLPLGTVAESIAMGRLIEREQIEKSAAVRGKRNGLVSAIHRAKLRGAPAEELERLTSELRGLLMPQRAREIAAAAVGLKESQYQRAIQVIVAAERDPVTYGDLVPILERSIHSAHDALRKRRGDTIKKKASRAAAKNPFLHKGLLPKHNEMMERAVRTLDGAVMGLKLVDPAQLDMTRLAPWLAALTETAFYLHRLHRELMKRYDEE
jgi:hypothetical protein